MATNSLHTNTPFSTFPLWGKLFDGASILPHSNTGEKLALAQQALAQIRKTQLENMIFSDENDKQTIIAKFETEMTEIKKALATGYRDYPLLDTTMVITDDGPKPILFRRAASNELAVTDWLNFTIHKSTFDSMKRAKLNGYRHLNIDDCIVTNSDYAYACSDMLKDIFGFGIESKMANGLNYYKEAYKLENGCGNICIGGQNDTILVTITGVGCSVGKYGWEEDLHAWLRLFAHRPKITRIDFAFDDLESKIASVAWGEEQWRLGGFKSGGRPPAFNIIGDWWQPDGSGSTLYIGKRTSSKFCRIYEKGKQLGSPDSKWTRVEVEYKAHDFHIPLDALLHPTQHFLAAYPCFHAFDYETLPVKFEVIQKSAEIIWEKAVEICRHQMGRFISAFRSVYQDDSLLLDVLTHERYEYPKRLKPLTLDYSKSMPPSALPA